MPRLFLLSPANASGKRAQMLVRPAASFDLAVRLRTVGAPIGEVFSFLSGLYFRGKLTYATRFAAAADAIRVITSDRGLVDPATMVMLGDLRAMSTGAIDHAHDPYRMPLARDVALHADAVPMCDAILLGSVATDKYVAVLHPLFGDRLLFPAAFVGRGDMSRGGLMLRCAREGRELDYAAVMTTMRRGSRPARLVPTRERHPSSQLAKASTRKRTARTTAMHIRSEMIVDGHTVTLTNLDKVFWPADDFTKRDLLQYYLDVAPVLLPHLRDRAMVMKRYPNGIAGECFFMKHAPSPRPDWIEICRIDHASGNVVDFPMIQDRASLLWCVNLGCIDLNQWYARCDDVDRPDYLHFDLDPVPGANFAKVTQAALVVRDALVQLKMRPLVKTTGSRGFHIYVPIVRGPTQKQVWTVAKACALELAAQHPKLLTAVYRVADRPRGRVLVDYNQNAWGRTLASVYSVRPRAGAPVSTPVTWNEVEAGVAIGDFTMRNVPARIRQLGDLWKPLLAARGRFKLESLL
jgi:bifunctional non-homologous end joining protein LigD